MKNGVLLTATLLGSLLISAQAVAGASANIGATSNYIWRGVTQTEDRGALQAGVDYSAENGLYVGAWGSNVDFGDETAYQGMEVDLYGGYKKELANGVSVDVGAITYLYPSEEAQADATELYVKGGYKGIGAEISYTADVEDPAVEKGNLYYALGYNGKLPNDWAYGVKAGKVDIKAANGDGDYDHQQVSLTKTVGKAGDLTLAIDDNDLPDTDPVVSLSWKKSFDF